MTYSRWRDTGLRFEFRTFPVFYQRHGQGSSALLLIHGFPTASWDWEPIWPALCERFAHVLAPDLLGFGHSPKPPRHRYSLMEQADLCEALLQQQGVTEVDILAHDYGVSVAQELLARQLDRGGDGLRLRSVTLLNGGLFPETHRATRTQRLLRVPLLGAVLARLAGERRFGSNLAAVFGPSTQPSPIELHDFWQLASSHNGTRIMPRLLRYISERRKYRERWVGALTKTSVPLRLINGPVDPVSGAHMAARYAELVPNPDIVSLPGIGHYPQVEAPDRVLKAFFDFQRRRVEAS